MRAVTLQPKTSAENHNDKMKNSEKSLSELRLVQWACWDYVLKLIHQTLFHPKHNGKIQVGLNKTQ